MKSAGDHLERSYGSFIDDTRPMSFFKGLGEYMEYVFGQPTLKKVFEEQLMERNTHYTQLAALEEKTLQDLQAAKVKLLGCVKKHKLDPSKFQRFSTWDFHNNMNILEELDAYEKGGIRSSGFLSDAVGNYLFDIAANLLGLGYAKDVEGFLVTQEEYAKYYNQMTAPRMSIVVGNKHGCFIFSDTLPERHQEAGVIERGRILSPWGSFEKLYQFLQAYRGSMRNRDPMVNFGDGDVGELGIGEVDAVESMMMQGDLDKFLDAESFLGRANTSNDRPHRLEVGKFKSDIRTVHARLMRVAASGVGHENGFYIAKKGNDFHFNGDYLSLSKDADYYIVFDSLFTLLPEGGEVLYAKLGDEVRKRIKTSKRMSAPQMRKFLLRNLTDESNGFLRYAKIANTVSGGKKLIRTIRGKGIEFNNNKSA